MTIVSLLATLSLGGACSPGAEFGDITIELCPSLLTSTEDVELIVSRPEGFDMALPSGARLEDVDGQGPDELIWQVPQPSDGWHNSESIHINHLTGSETLSVRVHYSGGMQVASPTLLITKGLRLPVCVGGPDGGIFDAGPDVDGSIGGDAGDGGVLQNDIRVTNTVVGASQSPSMVSTPGGLAVAWVDSRDGNSEIYFATLTAAGAIEGGEVRVTDDVGASSAPSLVWTGTEYAVAWFDDRGEGNEIYFVRISSAGVVQGSPTRVTDTPGSAIYPSLVYNGSGFAVAWEDTRDTDFQIYFTLLDSAGIEINDDIRMTMTASEAAAASLVWNGSQYAISWQDKRNGGQGEIYFARYGVDGALLGTEVRITDAAERSSNPNLIWDGTGYAIAWEDARSNILNTFFVQVTAAGLKVGTEFSVSPSSSLALAPELLWTGSEYALAWSDNRFGNAEIMFADISSAGALMGTPARLTEAADTSGAPSLARYMSQTKIIWEDRRLGESELFFQQSAP